MNPEQTQAAWQSRTNLMAIMAVVAFLVQRHGVVLPVEIQGYAVDLLTLAIPALMAAAIWFRNRARAVIDRWF